MTIFRWIIFSLSALLALGMTVSFVVYIVTGIDDWNTLARRLRHWTYLILLFWFNLEVWGRVLLILINWT